MNTDVHRWENRNAGGLVGLPGNQERSQKNLATDEHGFSRMKQVESTSTEGSRQFVFNPWLSFPGFLASKFDSLLPFITPATQRAPLRAAEGGGIEFEKSMKPEKGMKR